MLSALLVVPLWAQPAGGRDGAAFAPRKGQWQVSLMLGSGQFYNERTSSYLLPSYDLFTGSIGLPNGSRDESGDLNTYLQISGINDNSLVNIAGLQAKYFLTDVWAVNLAFSMNISLTPKKDYIEGNDDVPDMIIPEQEYINAQITNNWHVSVGADHYFTLRNPRIHPYVGAVAGFQAAYIHTQEPYTGKTYNPTGVPEDELPEQVFLPPGKAGQVMGIKGAVVAGMEYSLAQGLILGLEFRPFAYRYDIIQIAPQGFDRYNAGHHNFKVFDMPMLKLGFRF
jgi:outer membrane protein W